MHNRHNLPKHLVRTAVRVMHTIPCHGVITAEGRVPIRRMNPVHIPRLDTEMAHVDICLGRARSSRTGRVVGHGRACVPGGRTGFPAAGIARGALTEPLAVTTAKHHAYTSAGLANPGHAAEDPDRHEGTDPGSVPNRGAFRDVAGADRSSVTGHERRRTVLPEPAAPLVPIPARPLLLEPIPLVPTPARANSTAPR